MQNNPAGYPNTDAHETSAVDVFKFLLDHDKVKSDIKERDKYPNIDGYLELVDERQIPFAKLEVQIKKLPTQEPKMVCPISLLSYTQIACYPVLFVAVDTEQNKAYWVHVTKSLIKKHFSECTQKTVTINFPNQNVIDGSDLTYIEEWKKLAEMYQEKIQLFDNIKHQWETLRKASNPILGTDNPDFVSIHLFLSKLNGLLENEFAIVKQIFYPKIWKLGFAFSSFKENEVVYAIYPIPYDKNDVQIKQIDESLREELKEQGLGSSGYYHDNPIKISPKEYAFKFVESKVNLILENRLLDYSIGFLAREFIFAFVDELYVQMGLPKKDSYSISELENAFFNYLFMWVEESVKLIVKKQRNRIVHPIQLTYRKGYFDPKMLDCQIFGNEQEQIAKIVETRIQRKELPPRIVLGNEKLPFGLFRDFIHFLKISGFDVINRVYAPKDFSRLHDGHGLVYSLLTAKAVEENLKIFFENLQDVYEGVVINNFLKIKNEIKLFDGASLLVVLFDAKDNYDGVRQFPSFELYCFKDEDDSDLKIALYKKDDPHAPELSFDFSRENFEFEGKSYKLISGRSGILDFIYDDLPMLSFINKEFATNFKKYFKTVCNGALPYYV